MSLNVKIELVAGCEMPTRGSEGAAGHDLRARIPEGKIAIPPGEWRAVGLGVKVQPPKGWFGLLCIRSGISKRGLRLTTGSSVIDEDYTGEIQACIYNDSSIDQTIYNGDRVCQIVFLETSEVEWERVDRLSDTSRGDGGFGSTGRR